MTLPTITTKQQEILKLLYRYRFLDRIQIQAFMGHKDRRRIGAWLKDLREKQYVQWIYATGFTERTNPAIYYLDLGGIRFLRQLGTYSPDELHKRYREPSRKPDFIARCLLTADCCLNLEAQSKGGLKYSYATEADYANPDSDYNFLSELRPHLCFIKKTPKATAGYLLEVFDITTPRYKLKKRLKDYVNYLSEGAWEQETGDDGPPTVLIACPSVPELTYAKRRTRKLLQDIWGKDTPEDIRLRFATVAQVKSEGVTGIIWEEV